LYYRRDTKEPDYEEDKDQLEEKQEEEGRELQTAFGVVITDALKFVTLSPFYYL
jgi:hypothetical protein